MRCRCRSTATGDDVGRLHGWLFGGDSPSRHGEGMMLTGPSRAAVDDYFRRHRRVRRREESAIERAPAAAAGGNVNVMGADVPQQAIRAGLLDEILIHLVPVLLGDGKRLFDHLGGVPIELDRTHVVEAPEGVTHLRFRIMRRP